MARRTGLNLLSAVGLGKLAPGTHPDTGKPIPKRYADGGGLYAAISANGIGRSWVFRSRRGGKVSEIGLGSLNAVPLRRAREKAQAFREQLADGKDPLAERQAAQQASRIAAAKATTFAEAAQAYIRSHQAGWRSPKSLVSWEHTLSAFAEPTLSADATWRRALRSPGCGPSCRSTGRQSISPKLNSTSFAGGGRPMIGIRSANSIRASGHRHRTKGPDI